MFPRQGFGEDICSDSGAAEEILERRGDAIVEGMERRVAQGVGWERTCMTVRGEEICKDERGEETFPRRVQIADMCSIRLEQNVFPRLVFGEDTCAGSCVGHCLYRNAVIQYMLFSLTTRETRVQILAAQLQPGTGRGNLCRTQVERGRVLQL